MSIKRYTATKDNTITDAFKENLISSASLSNLGASDILEVFSIYGQATTSSIEKSRVIVQFPISEIINSRSSSTIPESGSVTFKLKMFNATHAETVPTGFTMAIHPISTSWTEGIGLDMETYKDLDASNWISASLGQRWTSEGGDYLDNALYNKVVTFSSGLEDIDIDVTNVVESWIKEDISDNGFLLKLSGSFEDGSRERSFFTKRFFARGSEYFFRRPIIEAQWDNSISDDRGNIIKSSSLAPAADNLNNIYLYNKVRGQLRDIPDTGSHLVVQMFTSSTGGTPQGLDVAGGVPQGIPFITASRESTGVYKAQFSYSGSQSTLYDVWFKSINDSSITTLFTGSAFSVESESPSNYQGETDYIFNITNLKSSYSRKDKVTFNVYTRNKNWQPNIYTVAKNKSKANCVKEAYYSISRVADNLRIIEYSTSSIPSYSKLSYDVSGSSFNLDMSILESDYLYEIRFLRKEGSGYVEQQEKFRFRVD